MAVVTVSNDWFHGMEDRDIVIEFSRLYHNCIAHWIRNEKDESEEYYMEYKMKMEIFIPYLCEKKAAYYMHNKEAVERFEKLHRTICRIKNEMENDLWNMEQIQE